METFDDLRRRHLLRQAATDAVVGDVAWLIGEPPGSHRWTSTKRDLIELVRTAWLAATLTDSTGLPLTQRQLARQAFAAVGRTMPAQMEAEIVLIERRTQMPTMTERYMAMGAHKGLIRRFMNEENNP